MRDRDERGFVLVTSLVLLMILSVMLIGLFYRGKVNQDTSVSSAKATKAYYLAEAGLNYIAWALHADPSDQTLDNTVDLDGDGVADTLELLNEPDQAMDHTLGYFDISNTIDYDPSSPTGVDVSTLTAPPHVALDITTNAQNVPSVVPKAWNNGKSFPSGDGAIVWVLPAVLDVTDAKKEKDTSVTSSSYALYAYAIAYVNGSPKRVLRAEIGSVTFGFPTSIGATTNSYQ